MIIQIKPLRANMRVPVFSTAGSAGADVHAALDAPIYIHPGETRMIPLGFAMRMMNFDGWQCAAFLLPRSGLGHRNGIVLGNLVGLIDADYRDEVCASVWNRNVDGQAFRINPEDRIAQLVVLPVYSPVFQIVGDLNATDRTGGFGSTGT